MMINGLSFVIEFIGKCSQGSGGFTILAPDSQKKGFSFFNENETGRKIEMKIDHN